MVMNLIPLADPGFCGTSTSPAVLTHRSSRAVIASAQVMMLRSDRSLRRQCNRMLAQRQSRKAVILDDVVAVRNCRSATAGACCCAIAATSRPAAAANYGKGLSRSDLIPQRASPCSSFSEGRRHRPLPAGQALPSEYLTGTTCHR